VPVPIVKGTPSVLELAVILGSWPVCAKVVVVGAEGCLRTRLPLASPPVAVTSRSYPAFITRTRASFLSRIHRSHGRKITSVARQPKSCMQQTCPMQRAPRARGQTNKKRAARAPKRVQRVPCKMDWQ
jgi:hypothetical protein